MHSDAHRYQQLLYLVLANPVYEAQAFICPVPVPSVADDGKMVRSSEVQLVQEIFEITSSASFIPI